MPSWAVAIIAERCSQAPQGDPGARVALLGAGFDLAAAHGDQGELGADEERVGQQGQGADGELERRSSGSPP